MLDKRGWGCYSYLWNVDAKDRRARRELLRARHRDSPETPPERAAFRVLLDKRGWGCYSHDMADTDRQRMFKAFVAGFDETIEGYNGEFSGHDTRESLEAQLRHSFNAWLEKEYA